MIFSKLTINTNEIHQEDFLKVIVLNLLRRGNDQLLPQNTLSKVFYLQKVSKNEMFKQFGVNANEIYSETFSKWCFKPLYERSNDRLLSFSTLSIAFCRL